MGDLVDIRRRTVQEIEIRDLRQQINGSVHEPHIKKLITYLYLLSTLTSHHRIGQIFHGIRIMVDDQGDRCDRKVRLGGRGRHVEDEEDEAEWW